MSCLMPLYGCSLMAVKRLHLILAGDVMESAGTRSYLREMLRHLPRAGVDLHTHLFQFRLTDEPPSGECRIDDFDAPVFLAPGGSWFRLLPRPLYRLFERFVLWRFLRSAMRQIAPQDAVIGSGCLGALYLGAGSLPVHAWWLKLGLIEEEGNRGIRYRIRKRIEAMHARRFANRIVVSKPMGDFIAGEYGSARGEQLILPCLVDLERFPPVTDRQALRQQYELGDRFVLTYVGTASPWQCAPETAAFFAMLLDKLPDAYFWVFTPDREPFEALLGNLSEENWKIDFKPHHELASILPAADMGCLVRRRERVNRVASPLKFPEYLSCGLPVLIGPEVGSYSRLVGDRHLGVVIDPDQPDTWPVAIEAILAMRGDAELRKRCRMEAEVLSWQTFAPQLAQAFSVDARGEKDSPPMEGTGAR